MKSSKKNHESASKKFEITEPDLKDLVDKIDMNEIMAEAEDENDMQVK